MGYLYVIVAATLWGIQGGIVKLLFRTQLQPVYLVYFRLCFSFLLLFLFLAIFRRDLLKIRWKDLPLFLSLGVGGVAMNFFLYYYAISRMNVAVAIFLQYLAPVVIAGYTCLFLKEKLTRTVAVAIVLAIFGCFLVVEVHRGDFLLLNKTGIMAGIGSALTWAWWSLHANHLQKRYEPFGLLFYALLFAALFWSTLVSPKEIGALSLTVTDLGGIFYVVVMATIVPFLLFFEGLKRIGATKAGVTSILEPITATFFAYWVLKEGLSFVQIIGTVMVIAAIVFLRMESWSRSQSE